MFFKKLSASNLATNNFSTYLTRQPNFKNKFWDDSYPAAEHELEEGEGVDEEDEEHEAIVGKLSGNSCEVVEEQQSSRKKRQILIIATPWYDDSHCPSSFYQKMTKVTLVTLASPEEECITYLNDHHPNAIIIENL